ncbi:MAG: hypothetical protein ACJ8M4_12705 [Chthoniobacterales bacterium]
MIEVSSFWHGAALSNLELLCISSFLQNGVRYFLYGYDRPDNLPKDVVFKDASAILPRSRLFTYKAGTFNLGSVSGFSNLFRYTLIHRQGGWWTDTDICYVDGLADEFEETFFEEASLDGEFRVATALFKGSANSPSLQYCLDRFAEKEVAAIVHGETGPSLLTAAVLTCEGQANVFPSDSVFRVPWWDYKRLFFDADVSIEDCAAVHFWNAKVTSDGLDKNGEYPPGSVFERLKRKYL